MSTESDQYNVVRSAWQLLVVFPRMKLFKQMKFVIFNIAVLTAGREGKEIIMT